MDLTWLPDSGLPRAAAILALAVLAQLLISTAKRAAGRSVGPAGAQRPPGSRRHPKLATLLSLLFSALTFTLWFAAVGMVLAGFDVDLTAYFATATVLGLAIGFGSQGLVQDIVIGITLIFTDALDVGDTVEVSGQVGRVEKVGLRFTTLTNFVGQTVYIPNRNISVVGRYRGGVIRAFLDVQVPGDADPAVIEARLHDLATGFAAQHPAAVQGPPNLLGLQETGAGGWRYIRLEIRLWPGQQALVETNLRQRVLAFMKGVDDTYADWMVPVTYRVR